MRVVGFGAAELIVLDDWAGAVGRRAARKILKEAAPAVVADDEVEFSVGAEAQDAAVVVAARGLARVLLQRAKAYEVSVERERRAVPDVAVNAVAEQGHFVNRARVNARRAFRPVEVDETVRGEVRVQGDAEKAALRSVVDGEIEHSALHLSILHAQHAARRLLKNQKIVSADEGDACRLVQTCNDRADAEVRDGHRGAV